MEEKIFYLKLAGSGQMLSKPKHCIRVSLKDEPVLLINNFEPIQN